ncbi:hypothetical protein E2C01_011929 [Portunus trituberculatus]|uniref:Uncharacterized protein n=1 Tax=Portunus trituberculatus TaxID=210409 RepID=A0A5B7DD97_PORTR|nr:hypothetical protein [Portunus trituberculatus]
MSLHHRRHRLVLFNELQFLRFCCHGCASVLFPPWRGGAPLLHGCLGAVHLLATPAKPRHHNFHAFTLYLPSAEKSPAACPAALRPASRSAGGDTHAKAAAASIIGITETPVCSAATTITLTGAPFSAVI